MNKAFEEILNGLKALVSYHAEKAALFDEDGELLAMDKEDAIVCAYENAIKNVEEVAKSYNNGWIPCSERLPEYGEAVMCSCSNGGITISCVTHKDVKPSKTVRFGQHSVVAWQPLPEPFKEHED